MRSNISINEWADCLGRLRDARALILRDAEAFHEAAMSLEHVGQVLRGKIENGLGGYRDELLDLACADGRKDPDETSRLFHVVKDARNMAVHEGAWARHLSSRLVDLFLILEEAILAKMTRVEDIMVRTPVIAEPWHMISHVRKSMLANSFSYLPLLLDGAWRIVGDASVMRYLRTAPDETERRKRLASQVGPLVGAGQLPATLAIYCSPDDTLDQLLEKIRDQPVLVIQNPDSAPRLLGLVMPFDLL
jgi:hypothetical protein